MIVRDRYFIKIVPRNGDSIHRFEVTRRHIVAAACAVVLALVGALGVHAYQLHTAKTQLEALQNLTATQQSQLKTIDQQTSELKSQLQRVQRQNQQIQQLIGIQSKSAAHPTRTKMSRIDPRGKFATQAAGIQEQLRMLSAASSQTSAEAADLQRLTMRILNVRHIEAITRERMIAAIPSIRPVTGDIVGCYCYRTYPDSEFHPGVDLSGNYGDTVRAAAAGIVASADWDGGYGIKVDIDHGNGYHTWYAHLSRATVRPGDRVVKGEPIALVGSTGFSTGPHLHYQVMLNGSPTDPTPYLQGVPAKVLASLP